MEYNLIKFVDNNRKLLLSRELTLLLYYLNAHEHYIIITFIFTQDVNILMIHKVLMIIRSLEDLFVANKNDCVQWIQTITEKIKDCNAMFGK